MYSKLCKKIITLVVALSLSLIGCVSAYADTTGTGSATGSVKVTGTVTALTVSVSHPLSVSYSINPDTKVFTAPDFTITNNTKVPVNVTITSLVAAPVSVDNPTPFTDVLPSAKVWETLNAADSAKYIALGIKAKNSTGWATYYSTSTKYAADGTALTIGSLAASVTGTLSLTANFGLSFNTAVTSSHNLVLSFTLV